MPTFRYLDETGQWMNVEQIQRLYITDEGVDPEYGTEEVWATLPSLEMLLHTGNHDTCIAFIEELIA